MNIDCPLCGEDLTKFLSKKKICREKGVFVSYCCKKILRFKEGKIEEL